METKIIFYGAPWCGDCIRSRQVFKKQNVDYQYIDIDQDPQAADKVVKINGGNRSIPTIVFPDGEVLVEPSNQILQNKLTQLSKSS